MLINVSFIVFAFLVPVIDVIFIILVLSFVYLKTISAVAWKVLSKLLKELTSIAFTMGAELFDIQSDWLTLFFEFRTLRKLSCYSCGKFSGLCNETCGFGACANGDGRSGG